MPLICPICEASLSKIDKQHLRMHDLTLDQYKITYPDGPFGYSEELRAKKSGKNHPLTGKKRPKEHCEKISSGMKTLWETWEATDKQKEHAAQMGMKDGISVNKGKPRPKSIKYRKAQSERLLSRYKMKPNEGEHFWHLRNTMNKWATFSEDCSHHNFIFTCLTCNTTSKSSLRNMHRHEYSQTLCKTCYPNEKTSSKAEREIGDYIRSLGILATSNARGILSDAGEIDIFIPSLNIGIEYHGLYYHSWPQLTDTKRHRRKYEAARDRNIHLIQIFEDEWTEHPEIVKARLRTVLQCKSMKIYARKCIVKKIEHSISEAFLNEYHIQGGRVRTGRNYGLFYNDELISVMTFSAPRNAMNHKSVDGIKKLELVRYATKADTSIIGGMNKILKAVIKDENPAVIESWADLRWVNPHSNTYLRNGFKLVSESILGYFYTDYVKRFHRFGFRKPADCPLGMKEGEYWATKGFFQICDCGQQLYELTLVV